MNAGVLLLAIGFQHILTAEITMGRKCILLIVLGMFATAVSWAQEKEATQTTESSTKNQLIGSWRLVDASTPGSPSGVGTRLKIFTDVHWAIIQPQENGNIVFVHGGTYEWDGSILKTNHDFAGTTTLSLIGKVTSLRIKIDGDKIVQSDADGIYNETWERVQPSASSHKNNDTPEN